MIIFDGTMSIVSGAVSTISGTMSIVGGIVTSSYGTMSIFSWNYEHY